MKLRLLPILGCLAVPGVGFAQDLSTPKAGDFTDLKLEDLMNVDVTNAFKTPMPLMQVPAAFYVVTQDEIRRSGAINVPEALRLVPGVQVSRTGANYYVLTIRGFGSNPSNKLLVLVDGRTIYTPFQDGVYWEIENMVMEDIDRIEVIRGPGGSLWGANAVNGIINIVTKKAQDTSGGLVSQSVGTLDRNESSFRYGLDLGAANALRVYGKYGSTISSQNSDGTAAGDRSTLSLGGFHGDFNLANQNSLMVEGQLGRYFIAENQPIALVTPPYSYLATNNDSVTTSDIVARWSHEGTNGASTSAQIYYDLVDYPYTDQPSTGTTYDLEFDHRFATTHGQSISVGGGYRYMINDSLASVSESLMPLMRRDTIVSAYAQDDLATSKFTHLTAGFKLEHNDYSGYEFEPNLRFAYTPNNDHTVWASVGQAVRTPSQSEANIFSISSVNPPTGNDPNPVASANIGNPNLTSEKVISAEVGYRTQSGGGAAFDVSAFYNAYSDLVYLSPGQPFTSNLFGTPLTIDPSYYRNGDKGQTYGLELSSKFKLSKTLDLTLGSSALEHTNFGLGTDLSSPPLQFVAHLGWTPTPKVELDAMLHWYDSIQELAVPAYTKLDLRAGWKASKSWDFSLTGYDLLANRHGEFGTQLSLTSGAVNLSSYIPRSVIAKATYKF